MKIKAPAPIFGLGGVIEAGYRFHRHIHRVILMVSDRHIATIPPQALNVCPSNPARMLH